MFEPKREIQDNFREVPGISCFRVLNFVYFMFSSFEFHVFCVGFFGRFYREGPFVVVGGDQPHDNKHDVCVVMFVA